MSRYVWRNGHWRDPKTGTPMELRHPGAVCKPQIMPDIREYLSPITGEPITTRGARREDLRKHGCVEVDPKPRRGLRNARFAKKWGAVDKLHPEVRETVKG